MRSWGILICLSFAVLATCPAGAADLLPKSQYCTRWLNLAINLNETAEPSSTRTPMWQGYYDNMVLLGYPNKFIEDKIAKLIGNWPVVVEIMKQYEEGSQPTPGHVLEYLGFWANVPGFNATAYVVNFLHTTKVVDDTKLKALILWSHVWIRSPYHGSQSALSIVNHFLFGIQTSVIIPYNWLSRAFGVSQSKLNPLYSKYILQYFHEDARYSSDQNSALLKVLATVPTKIVPKTMMKKAALWLDLVKYPPVTINSVNYCQQGYHSTGICEFMANGHLGTLGIIDSKYSKKRKNIFVKVDGYVVGSFKRTGDKSMVALRNVVDSEGRLVLALGGVYQVSYLLAEGLDKLPLASTKTWTGVELSELRVHPSTFMMNEEAWSTTNLYGLLKFLQDELTKDQLIDFFYSMNEEGNTAWKMEGITRTAWPKLLERLNDIRISVEDQALIP